MKKYQGESVRYLITGDDDFGHPIESFENYYAKAVLYDQYKNIKKTWSTEDGGITKGTTQRCGKTYGFLKIEMSGDETAAMDVGLYSLEMATLTYTTEDGVVVKDRAIGKLQDMLEIEDAILKDYDIQ